jgi:hypothetical protein
MATDTVRSIFHSILYLDPVKGVFVSSDTLETVACHFLLIFMTAGTQDYYFFLTSSLPHPVGEMGIESFGPVG